MGWKLAICLAALTACADRPSIDLTIIPSSQLTRQQLEVISVLEFTFAGALEVTGERPLNRAFADGTERVSISSTKSGDLRIMVRALDAARTLIALGEKTVRLEPKRLPVSMTLAPDRGIVLMPSSHDYGEVVQGRQKEFEFTVTNDGDVETGNLSVSIEGADAAMFVPGVDLCSGAKLLPAQSCTIGVRFSPPAIGRRGASLIVNAAYPGGTTTASILGTAVLPVSLSVSPSSLHFGSFVSGTTSADIIFTVNNDGQEPSGSIYPYFAGTDAAFFEFGTDGCSGKTLAHGEACSVSVRFKALTGANGPRMAAVKFAQGVGGPGDGTALLEASSGIAKSCNNVGPLCGANGSTDCCKTLLVPNGHVFRQNRTTIATWEASVGEFYLDAYEVTVARFRNFAASGGPTQASPPTLGSGEYRYVSSGAYQTVVGSGWRSEWNSALVADMTALKAALNCGASNVTWTDNPGLNEEKPINCVSWYEAFAFCAWDGGWLPSETQWFFAAAGGDDQRGYPWGAGLDTSRANYCPTGPCGGPLAVGAKMAGDGRWGHADLVGNLWEWTRDWYTDPPPYPCTDCAVITTMAATPHRTLWGGSFSSPSGQLSLTGPASRGEEDPMARSPSYGFRCARPR